MVIEKLLSDILGDTKVKEKDYPKVDWLQVDGNAFSVMGKAKQAWRKLDAGVASRIAPVCMKGDYDTLLALCIALCPEGDEEEND